MGIATGCIGMSLRDFFRCTPSEFYAINSAWRELCDAEQQGAWERSRFVAATLLQPHTRRHLKPRDICLFPWEKQSSAHGAETTENNNRSTRERFEELKKLWG